ncbi:MAG: histidine phosphatase family protein [Solirubrobacteraceae bacterium]
MKRLLLVRHGPTSASDARAFPLDEPLSAAGREFAASLRGALPAAGAWLSSPAARCLQTVAALHASAAIEPRIAECDFGTWAGQTLGALNASDPDGVGRWMLDPAAAPHGGESLQRFYERVSAWLDSVASRDAKAEADASAAEPPIVAVTHGGVIKAAVVHALGAPLKDFWQVSAAPLSVTELALRQASWELVRVNAITNPAPA